MAEHRTLTGASLHEPKGADSAAANTTYFADGTGNGTWRKVSSADIDSTAKEHVALSFTVSNVSDTIFIPCPMTGTVTDFYAIAQSSAGAGVAGSLTVDGSALALPGTPVAGNVLAATGGACTKGNALSCVYVAPNTVQADGYQITILIREV